MPAGHSLVKASRSGMFFFVEDFKLQINLIYIYYIHIYAS